MATQQAWDDFCDLRNKVGYLTGLLSNTIKDSVLKLEELVSTIVADPARTADVAALADTHPTDTSAYLLAQYAKLLAVRDFLVSQGF